MRQSDRDALYRAALARLTAAGLVYVCDCSRRKILDAQPVPAGAELRYPGTCRARNLPESASAMRRVRIDEGGVAFDDLRLGVQRQSPSEQCGDLLARDRDGHWTYQFAVVVDDLAQGIGVVIRGEDLLESTGRQILLGRRLGRADLPRFLHHPLVRHPDGAKLSKSNRDTGLADLRAAGWSAGRTLGEAAFRAGLLPAPRDLAAADLAGLFADRG